MLLTRVHEEMKRQMDWQELQALKFSNGKQVGIREHITAGLSADDSQSQRKGLLLLFCIVCAGTPWGVLTAWDSQSPSMQRDQYFSFSNPYSFGSGWCWKWTIWVLVLGNKNKSLKHLAGCTFHWQPISAAPDTQVGKKNEWAVVIWKKYK